MADDRAEHLFRVITHNATWGFTVRDHEAGAYVAACAPIGRKLIGGLLLSTALRTLAGRGYSVAEVDILPAGEVVDCG